MKLNLMEITKITSAQNQTIKKIAKWSTNNKARKADQIVILDGEHLCQEWDKHFEYLIFTSQYSGTTKFPAKNYIEVPQQLMSKMAPTKSPSGILGVIKKPGANLEKLAESRFVLLLESVQDPGNIGTIIRTAAASGVDTIFMNATCADVWSPKVLRAGMGGHFKLNLVEDVDLLQIKDHFDGPLFGTFMEGENLFTTSLPQKCGFIMGNEGAGVSAELKNICDHKINIPMQNNVESLNVAMAAGLCVYEHMRQRNN